MAHENLEEILRKHSKEFFKVVPFSDSDPLLQMDFSENNTDLTPAIYNDIQSFTQYINEKLKAANAKYGIGGYDEHRTIYSFSPLFNESSKFSDSPKVSPNGGDLEGGGAPRRLHLGIDIWGKINTPVRVPLDGIVHSFAFNNNLGDYGATIILSHQLERISFYTLYGHLSLSSIKNLQEGSRIKKGDVFAEFGIPQENGHWPPHLHFQIIKDLEGWKGDYPGVCQYSQREKYLANCPDPDLILGMMQYAH